MYVCVFSKCSLRKDLGKDLGAVEGACALSRRRPPGAAAFAMPSRAMRSDLATARLMKNAVSPSWAQAPSPGLKECATTREASEIQGIPSGAFRH